MTLITDTFCAEKWLIPHVDEEALDVGVAKGAGVAEDQDAEAARTTTRNGEHPQPLSAQL